MPGRRKEDKSSCSKRCHCDHLCCLCMGKRWRSPFGRWISFVKLKVGIKGCIYIGTYWARNGSYPMSQLNIIITKLCHILKQNTSSIRHVKKLFMIGISMHGAFARLSLLSLSR